MKKVLFFLFFSINFLVIAQESESVRIAREHQPGGLYNPRSGGGGGYSSSSSINYYGALVIKPGTRGYWASFNYTNKKDLLHSVQSRCVNELGSLEKCNIIETISGKGLKYLGVAFSYDNKISAFGKGSSYKAAKEKAIKACKEKGGDNCELYIMAYNRYEPIYVPWGALVYNKKTNQAYSAKGYTTSIDAKNEVLKSAKCTEGSEDCWALTYQTQYAAIAVNPNNPSNYTYSTGSKSMEDVVLEAVKYCNKHHKIKNCEILTKAENK